MKKNCIICEKEFKPAPTCGSRQLTCLSDECRKEQRYRQNSKASKKWTAKNKEKVATNKREWSEKNKLYHRNMLKTYQQEREKIDPCFKLSRLIGSHVRSSMKNQGFKKTAKSAEYLGCTWETFKEYIEKQFTSGMTWENHGEVWELDHIFPISWCDTKEEIFIYSHYSNYQPLTVKDNRDKKDHFIGHPQYPPHN